MNCVVSPASVQKKGYESQNQPAKLVQRHIDVLE